MNSDPYVTDEASGVAWRLMLGDSCERLGELDDNSIDLSIFSPPFASLYTYSPSPRDLGNSFDRDEFLAHFGYIVAELMRVTKPGRRRSCFRRCIATRHRRGPRSPTISS
ncbi:MAG: hypothetical protein LC798_20770 [Chloroflexi bacterium]|nr:hypothetical protein [Chloroflexota bacterium]